MVQNKNFVLMVLSNRRHDSSRGNFLKIFLKIKMINKFFSEHKFAGQATGKGSLPQLVA